MRRLLMGVAGVLAIAAGSGALQAAPVVTGPISTKPTGPITVPGTIKVAKPDFVITKLAVVPVPNILGPGQIGKISVDFADNCHRGMSYKMYVQAAFYTSKGGKGLSSIGNTGGVGPDGIGHLDLDVASEHFPMTSYVYVEVDATHKIPEVVETNNYQSFNPNYAPFPQAAGYCNAK